MMRRSPRARQGEHRVCTGCAGSDIAQEGKWRPLVRRPCDIAGVRRKPSTGELGFMAMHLRRPFVMRQAQRRPSRRHRRMEERVPLSHKMPLRSTLRRPNGKARRVRRRMLGKHEAMLRVVTTSPCWAVRHQDRYLSSSRCPRLSDASRYAAACVAPRTKRGDGNSGEVQLDRRQSVRGGDRFLDVSTSNRKGGASIRPLHPVLSLPHNTTFACF